MTEYTHEDRKGGIIQYFLCKFNKHRGMGSWIRKR